LSHEDLNPGYPFCPTCGARFDADSVGSAAVEEARKTWWYILIYLIGLGAVVISLGIPAMFDVSGYWVLLATPLCLFVFWLLSASARTGLAERKWNPPLVVSLTLTLSFVIGTLWLAKRHDDNRPENRSKAAEAQRIAHQQAYCRKLVAIGFDPHFEPDSLTAGALRSALQPAGSPQTLIGAREPSWGWSCADERGNCLVVATFFSDPANAADPVHELKIRPPFPGSVRGVHTGQSWLDAAAIWKIAPYQQNHCVDWDDTWKACYAGYSTVEELSLTNKKVPK
jgi:hypothetical protein